MNNQEKQSAPMIGGNSLLVIFAVLCLTVFALLGLSTVQADKRLIDINIQAVSDYYAADCKAEEILAQLRSGSVPDGVSIIDSVYFYSCPISSGQELQVEVRSSDFHVLRWQAVSNGQWTPDNTLDLWNGNK